MKRIKSIVLIWTAAVVLAGSVTACGSKEQPDNSLQSEHVNSEAGIPTGTDSHDADMPQKEQGEKTSSNPTFSGDTMQFFGLDWEDALELAGSGATTDSSQYIVNESIGLEIYLTNSIDDMTTYQVHKVVFGSADAELSFLGICIGDTLKDADKILMEQDTIYKGELTWVLSTEEVEYTVMLATSDDKTVDSVEVDATVYSEYYPKENEEINNPYAYEQDMHEFEPAYWE